ncbi:MAG TPA: sulfotransferase, partial [Acidobacteria bacterium]|nr:sulfotransferase [Acidobacteriota bacterium]
AEIVVDSSKAPAYGFALSLIPDVELSVLLMVRDPRGVAYSWLRPKADPGRAGGYMKRFGATSSSVLWLTWNGATERLLKGRATRFAVLRYEDFAREPEASVGRIVSWLDLGPRDLPFDGPRTVVLAPTHTTSGNPDRERTGPVPIRLDQRWRSELPAWRRALVTALTWPMLARYGYVTASAGGGTAR